MKLLALLVAVAGLALVVGTSMASADELPVACELVSQSRLQSTDHLAHGAVIKDTSDLEGTAELEADELPEAIHTICDWGLWSGSKPKSHGAVIKKALGGRGAQVGFETWAPNEGGPNGEHWIEKGYEETTNGFLKGRLAAILAVPGTVKPLNSNGEGYSGTGALIKASGPAKGLIAAAGCWWDHTTHRDVCILDEEAEGKPVVDHLNALAKTIVPNFLGAL